MALETGWIQAIIDELPEVVGTVVDGVPVRVSRASKLAFANDILSYRGAAPHMQMLTGYETDLLVSDDLGEGRWTPRVVVACSADPMTTEHAIAHGALAQAHKMIHPYLRFGVLLCKPPRASLSGRLVRQGALIDFIAAWKTKAPDTDEMRTFADLIGEEVRASRLLHDIISNDHQNGGAHPTVLHRRLEVR